MYECRLGTVGGYSQCVRCDSSRASSVPRRDWRVPIIDHYGSEGVARFILHYAYVSQARAVNTQWPKGTSNTRLSTRL